MAHLISQLLYNPEGAGEKIRALIEPLDIVEPLFNAIVEVAEVYGHTRDTPKHLHRVATPIMRKVSHAKEYRELARGIDIDPGEPGLIGVFLMTLITQEYLRRTEVKN